MLPRKPKGRKHRNFLLLLAAEEKVARRQCLQPILIGPKTGRFGKNSLFTSSLVFPHLHICLTHRFFIFVLCAPWISKLMFPRAVFPRVKMFTDKQNWETLNVF